MNAWNLEDDISRIGSKAEDFLSGILVSESRVSDRKPRWKAHSDQDSDPFRQFQTPPSGRTSPTPLADLYSQSIYQAEVDSDSWQAPEQNNYTDPTDEEENCSPILKNVECMPQDLFSFSQQKTENYIESASTEPDSASKKPDAATTESDAASKESALETLNRSLTEPQNNSKVEETVSSSAEMPLSTEEVKNEFTPKLIVDTSIEEATPSFRHPLLSLSIGMSICGVGLVFGAQIMHNTAVVNPGKSLIIAGLIGLFASVVLQTVNWFGKRKTA